MKVKYDLKAITTIIISQTLASIIYYSIPVILPLLQNEFKLTNSQMGALASYGNLGVLIFLVISGFLVDKYGAINVLYLGNIFLSFTIFIITFITKFYILSILFLFLGVFYSFIIPATTELIINIFPVKKRGTYMGIKQTCVPLGGILAAVIITYFSSILNYNWKYSLVIIFIITIFWSIFFKKKLINKNILNYKQNKSYMKNRKMLSILKRILIEKNTLAIFAIGFLFGFIQFAVLNHLVLFISRSYNLKIKEAMIYLMILQLGAVIGRIFWGYISDKLLHGNRILILIKNSFIYIIIVILIMNFINRAGFLLGISIFILGAVTFGFAGVYFTFGVEKISSNMNGLKGSLCAMSTMVGGSISPYIFGYLVDYTGEYIYSWYFLIVIQLVNLIILLKIKKMDID